MRNAIACLFAVFAVLSANQPIYATQTDNRGIHAVPAPGPVVIDGKSDDWDLSGEILQCYDIETLKDVYSARIAMMYDANALYVSIHWKDPAPMGNSHDPHFQAGKGWAGDCVQLRFKTDRICHVTAWYYAGKQEPAIHIDYGKSLTEPFGGDQKVLFRTEGWKLDDGVEMAFLKDADSKGYVQEIKLPWKLIAKDKVPAAGDKIVCGIELLWGEADWPVHRYADNLAEGAGSREFFWTAHTSWGPVILEPKGKLKLPEPEYLKAAQGEQLEGPVQIAYDLPAEARVTVAIDDANGRRVRNLAAALPRKAGRNVEEWDGLDDNGKLVEPGEYAFKGLYHPGIHVNWTMSFCNPGNPTWGTPDGRGAFYGDHTNPQAAAAGGSYVALACPMGEAGQHLIGCDLSGQRLWGLANRAAFDGVHISLATDGNILWVGNESRKSTIYRVNIATGKYAPWKQTARDPSGKEYPVLDLPAGDEAFDAKPEDATGPYSAKPRPLNLLAVAYRDGVLAACLTVEGKIKLLDAETGKLKSVLSVPQPRSVTIDADGSLIVLSEGKLLRLTADGKGTPFTAEVFPDAYSLAIDAQRNVYLSVRGADQNVKVFSPDGKVLREIGKRGGRPNHGPWDENGMRNPAQIAIDSQGRLWVMEEAGNPKRTSVWGLDGKFLKDFIGTTGYAAAGAINPYDPTMGFAESTVFKIDLEKGSWRPVYSIGGRGSPDEIFPPQVHNITSRVVVRDGRTYVFTSDSARGSAEVHCTMLDGKDWRSASHTGVVRSEKAGGPATYNHPVFQGHEGQVYAWSDRNGDGLVQADEMTFATASIDGKPVPFRSYYWGQLPDPEGTIIYLASGGGALYRFPITGTTACGAPVYDVANPRIVRVDAGFTGNGEGMTIGGAGGRVYLNQSPLTAIGTDGKVLGTYPSRHVSVHGSHTATAARPGYVIGPSSFLGTVDIGGAVGEVFYLNGNLGENYLFTHDCLFIQSLFKDTRGWFETPEKAVRGMSFDATTAGGESFGGNFVRTPDGKCFLTLGGTDARVIEVTGLEKIKRFTGRFTFTPQQYLAAQQLAQEKAAKATKPKVYTVVKAAEPPKIDGKSDDWPELKDNAKALVEIQESAQRRYGRVQVRYDADNLYLAWRVFAPGNRMRNAGQDDKLLFKTGDCVDLMLGPADAKGGAGNLRLLLTVMAGRPAAILYEKAVPGTAEKDRIPFSSPWRTIYFDRVGKAAEVKLAAGQIDGGYFVEAAVPWSILGVAPKSGLKLRGDFGVLFADSGGTQTVSRQYWCNKATGLVNDVPGEADLAPNLWGELVLE